MLNLYKCMKYCLFTLCAQLEESKYSIEIKISDYKKIGDGMNAFMTFKVSTKVRFRESTGSYVYVTIQRS